MVSIKRKSEKEYVNLRPQDKDSKIIRTAKCYEKYARLNDEVNITVNIITMLTSTSIKDDLYLSPYIQLLLF